MWVWVGKLFKRARGASGRSWLGIALTLVAIAAPIAWGAIERNRADELAQTVETKTAALGAERERAVQAEAQLKLAREIRAELEEAIARLDAAAAARDTALRRIAQDTESTRRHLAALETQDESARSWLDQPVPGGVVDVVRGNGRLAAGAAADGAADAPPARVPD